MTICSSRCHWRVIWSGKTTTTENEESSWTVANWLGERSRANWGQFEYSVELIGEGKRRDADRLSEATYQIAVEDVIHELEEEFVDEEQSSRADFAREDK